MSETKKFRLPMLIAGPRKLISAVIPAGTQTARAIGRFLTALCGDFAGGTTRFGIHIVRPDPTRAV